MLANRDLCLKVTFTNRSETVVGWLVGCFGFSGPLRQYFSLYRAVSQREGERRERTDESKNVQTTPTRTYCKRNRPLPYCNQNCRTPRHWKFTQHTVMKKQIFPIYSLVTPPPPPRKSPFSVLKLYEGKVPKRRDFLIL